MAAGGETSPGSQSDVRRLFAEGPDVIVAGAINPTGSIEPVDDGYRVTGRWAFASGCEHADWLFGDCVEGIVDGVPKLRMALFTPDQVVIEDTWHVSGLRGTGSHHIRVDGVVIPPERTFLLMEDAPCLDVPIVRIPPPTLYCGCLASVALGIAQGALDDIVMRVVQAATQPMLRAIGKVVGSDVLADTVAFFQAFAGMESGFRERADAVMGLLRAEVTRYVVVTSPHRDAVEEAVWFSGKLAEHGIDDVAGVANRVHPSFGDGTADEASAAADAASRGGHDDVALLWRNLAELRALAGAAEAELAPLADLLGPLAAVPLLSGDVHDLEALGEIRGHLFGAP